MSKGCGCPPFGNTVHVSGTGWVCEEHFPAIMNMTKKQYQSMTHATCELAYAQSLLIKASRLKTPEKRMALIAEARKRMAEAERSLQNVGGA